jgi:GNAT superfamily N-acetyltransferase
MQIEILEENSDILPEYEKISIAFTVESIFHVELVKNGLGGIKLFEKRIEKPFIKDYDAFEEEKPSRLGARFNLSNWGILSAFDGENRIGGAIIAWKTPEVSMLEGRDDLVCLWDLRVEPEFRGKDVGHKLFARALDWSLGRNCRLMKVETQNINVPACRFYARQGCELVAVNRFAYPAEMNEIQMVWYRSL